VPNIHWQNSVDEATPYETGFKDKKWAVSSGLLLTPLVHRRKYNEQQKHQTIREQGKKNNFLCLHGRLQEHKGLSMLQVE
jgi:hypothetical protein